MHCMKATSVQQVAQVGTIKSQSTCTHLQRTRATYLLDTKLSAPIYLGETLGSA